MIVFDLRCGDEGHVFEAWFGSSQDYESQKARGLLTCPLCGTDEIEKAVMAPHVGPKGNQVQAHIPAPDAPASFSSDPDAIKTMLAAVAQAQRKLLENSTYVGDRFADEARAIHLGESEGRSIHGIATRTEAETLLDEGIRVSSLPFPVLEPGQEN